MKQNTIFLTIVFILTLSIVGAFIYAVHPKFGVVNHVTETSAYMKRDWIRSHFTRNQSAECKTVFVFGDSQIASAFLPKTFDNITKSFCSYNLAIVSHGVVNFDSMLNEAVEAGNLPDYILLYPSYERGPVFVYGSYEEYKIANPDKHYLDYLININTPGGSWYNWLSNYERYDKRIEEVSMIHHDRGAYWWGKRYEALEENFSDKSDNNNSLYNPNWSDDYIAKINRFTSNANNLGAKVYLIVPPLREGANKQRKDLSKTLFSILEQKYISGVLIDYDLMLSPVFFKDRGHTNPAGAEKYTSKLAEYAPSVLR